jgi:hypothetical protein
MRRDNKRGKDDLAECILFDLPQVLTRKDGGQ